MYEPWYSSSSMSGRYKKSLRHNGLERFLPACLVPDIKSNAWHVSCSVFIIWYAPYSLNIRLVKKPKRINQKWLQCTWLCHYLNSICNHNIFRYDNYADSTHLIFQKQHKCSTPITLYIVYVFCQTYLQSDVRWHWEGSQAESKENHHHVPVSSCSRFSTSQWCHRKCLSHGQLLATCRCVHFIDSFLHKRGIVWIQQKWPTPLESIMLYDKMRNISRSL